MSEAQQESPIVKEVAEVKTLAAATWGEFQPPEPATADDKLWGMLANISVLFFSILGPVAALVIKGGTSKFVKFYSIQMLLVGAALIGFSIITTIAFVILSYVPILALVAFFVVMGLYGLLGVAALALIVILGLKANSGVIYKLPMVGPMAYKMAYGA